MLSRRFLSLHLALIAVVAAGSGARADFCFEEGVVVRSDRSQIVSFLRIRLPAQRSGAGFVWASFFGDEQIYESSLTCWAAAPGAPENAWQCGTSCDGGAFTAWPGAPGLELHTRGGFLAGDACEGGASARRVTHDGAVRSVFRLPAVALTRCALGVD